jgi:LPXTG-motif cell wall-anchored protein
MHTVRGFFYGFLLGVGGALVGFVIGVLIKPPTTSVTFILLAIGLLFLIGAFLLRRRVRRE